MPYPSRPVTMFRVWATLREAGRCKYCRRRILWLTRDTAKRLPVDIDVQIRDTQLDETLQVPFGYVMGADVHSCPEGRAARARTDKPRLF
jgi:hypothetical protein